MKKVICFLLFGLILFFNSCKNSSVKFEKNFTFERNNWIRFKTVNFDFDIEDTASFYDVSLTVRHNKDYPNSNLLTYIYITYPNGEKRYLESNIKIRNEKNKFIGKTIETFWEVSNPVMSNIHLLAKGNYKVEIGNLMSKYDNPGIIQVGLIIKKSKE